MWLIDTVAARSVLSFEVYNSLPASVKFSLSSENSANALANGQQAKTYGVGHVVMRLGNSEFQMHVIVAEIEDEGILGMDFLSQVDSRIDIATNCQLMAKCLIVLISRTNPLVPDLWFDGQVLLYSSYID